LPPLLVGLGFTDRAIRRFAERMTHAGRYHVFRAGQRYYLDGEFVIEATYRKRGHASAGAWILRDAKGEVAAEDVECFDEVVPEPDIRARARTPPTPLATTSALARSVGMDLATPRALRTA